MKTKITIKKRLQNRQRKLSRRWIRAAGLLKGKNIDPVKYQQKKRAEWK